MRQVSASYSPSLPCHLLACCIFPWLHLHCVIMCIALHCIRVNLMHPSIFPVVRFAIWHSYVLRRPLLPLFVSGVKHSRNGLWFAKRPRYTTGRPPVKFRTIWSPFDTPTVNRVTAKPSFVAAQHLSNLAQNPPKPSPSSQSFDHDRVAENRTSFGLS